MYCLYCSAFLDEDPHLDDCPNPKNDFQEVNENTKEILREIHKKMWGEMTIEFLAAGSDVQHLGSIRVYASGNVSVALHDDDNSAHGREILDYIFWFDEESAKAWQTFVVETSETEQTYEDTPLRLVTRWRLAPSTRPTEALQSSEPVEPITDTATPARLDASSLDYTARGVGQFFNSFFYNDNRMRLGQAAVFAFKDLPKELADKIFYEEDMKHVGELLWQGLFCE